AAGAVGHVAAPGGGVEGIVGARVAVVAALHRLRVERAARTGGAVVTTVVQIDAVAVVALLAGLDDPVAAAGAARPGDLDLRTEAGRARRRRGDRRERAGLRAEEIHARGARRADQAPVAGRRPGEPAAVE